MIPTKILEYAQATGLDWIATGGGCDFIYRKTTTGVHMLLVDGEDSGVGPEKLLDPARVVMHNTREFNGSFCDVKFDTARRAMDFMAEAEVWMNDPEREPNTPVLSEQYPAYRIDWPELAEHKKFIKWLNSPKTRCMTWHRKGDACGDYSDCMFWKDTGKWDGSDTDMPEDVWKKLVDLVGDGACWIWLTLVGCEDLK